VIGTPVEDAGHTGTIDQVQAAIAEIKTVKILVIPAIEAEIGKTLEGETHLMIINEGIKMKKRNRRCPWSLKAK
jgi:hypothetical protein